MAVRVTAAFMGLVVRPAAFYDQIKAVISDYGPAGAAGAWATPPHPLGPQDRLRDYGPEEAAGRRRRAVGTARHFQGLQAYREQRTPPSTLQGPQYLSGTTGRTDPPDGYARSTPLQADDSTTLPSGSGPTRQPDALDLESSSTCQGQTRPGQDMFSLLMQRCFASR